MSALAAMLDTQHRGLIGRLQHFRDMVTAESHTANQLRVLLSEIHDDLVTHFRFEEEGMRATRFGGYWDHKDDHIALWRAFLRLEESCDRMTYRGACGTQLYESMKGLLERHAERFDSDLVVFVGKTLKL